MITRKKINEDGWEMIPVYGAVIAGEPQFRFEYEDTYEIIPPELSEKGECFAMRVWGDSMEPEMTEGDVVIVLSRHDCNNGELAVVSVDGGNATVKRVYKENGECRLVSRSEAYDDMVYSMTGERRADIKIMGVVIELRKKFDKIRYAR